MELIRYIKGGLVLGELLIIVIPYRHFKEKIRLVKQYILDYKIEDWNGSLYLEKREVGI